MADDDFYANGEEFASPTISTVGKDRVNYEEKIGSKERRKTKAVLYHGVYIFFLKVLTRFCFCVKIQKTEHLKAMTRNSRCSLCYRERAVGASPYGRNVEPIFELRAEL